MFGFPVGMIALIIVTILVYFGLAHRILDRMRLTDKAALLILVGIIIGSFINIPLSRGRIDVSINVGGAIIPVGLAIYVLSRAGTTKEWIRAIAATIATTAVSYILTVYFMSEDPWQGGTDFIDPLFVYPIIAGLVAYLVGRSRRSAFIAATLGVLGMDIIEFIRVLRSSTPAAVNIGGAGAFDTIILSGIIAVLLAEIIGETRERLQGGPKSEGRPKELLRALDGVELDQESNRNPQPAFKKDLRDKNKDDGHKLGVLIMNRRILSYLTLLVITLGSVAYLKVIPTSNSQIDNFDNLAEVSSLGFWEAERDDGGYYTIVDEQGNVLDKMARVVYLGDELIAEDNNQYRIVKITGDTAIATLVEENVLAEHEALVKEALSNQTIPVQTDNKGVALYHTHSAESYVPNEGTDSLPGKGGILKVGDALAEKLKEKGVDVTHSKTPHEPRDANAYIRSRRTALELLKAGPSTIIDVHRDGIPDPNFYSKEIAGNNATSIRLVVGRQNQNMQANLDFAKTVKAGMNEIYPGLVKSIFMAKGNYNQDLSPRSMLIEVGTHTNDRTQAENGAKLFADALPSVLGIATNAPSGQTKNAPSTGGGGDWSSLWWILGIAVVGGGLFLLISTGSLQGAKDKLQQFTSSEWANYLGKTLKTNRKLSLGKQDEKDKDFDRESSEE